MHFRLLALLVLALLLSGCSVGLQQRWSDFNAYYNTFYNARQSYEAGIRSLESQNVDINAERPVRIHRTPVRAGQSDFERAIEKSADVLRNHRESKWVDDALELIGKSYFHLGQYFSAEQKFNEILQTSVNPELLQRAIYWRGRVFLETNRYNEGIQYLVGTLNSDEHNWNQQIQQEIYMVLAQLHVQLQQWEEATDYLDRALPGFRDELLRSRAAFLNGQLHERLDQPQAAIDAYRQVSRRYPEYQLIFLAQLRENQLLRQQGETRLALRNLTAMSRDDKNFDQLSLLEYEIGRTLQAMQQHDEAFQVFDEVLYQSIQNPTRETIAKTHYAVAELYRFAYGDFSTAALYYDSSSRSATDLTRLPEAFDAAELAASFGEYARLRNEISARDSLLFLGQLPVSEFEERIVQIRDQRLREFERQQRQDQLRGTTVVTVTDNDQDTTQDTGQNGFLNHLNPTLVAQAAASFAAVWESRPLVDNWRRREAVRQAVIAIEAGELQEEVIEPDTSSLAEVLDVEIPPELQINLADIPRTAAAQRTMKAEIAGLEFELGNVFYLNLDMPDSALVSYLRVAEEFTDSEVRPQALYSIADIYWSAGDQATALQWAETVLEEYPSNSVAQRIATRLNIDADLTGASVSDTEVASQEYNRLLEVLGEMTPELQIENLTSFVQRHPSSDRLAEALFTKALAFAEIGRSQDAFSDKFFQLEQARASWQQQQREFSQLQDSIGVILQDTTLTPEQIAGYTAIQDSTLSQPDLDAYFPYDSPAWDSTRATLSTLVEQFQGDRLTERARIMLETLRIPDSLQEESPTDTTAAITEFPDDFLAEFHPCDALDEPIQFLEEIDSFLTRTGFEEMMRSEGVLSADFEFDVSVDHTGTITNATSLVDDPTGLANALSELLIREGRFSQPRSGDEPAQTTCYFSVSVDFQP